MIPLLGYLLYLLISIALTLWVGQTLFRNGRVFLLRLLDKDDGLTDAVNMMLLVGFYLVNIGAAVLFLSQGRVPSTALELVEYLSSKIGLVLLILGIMHFGNMFAVWFIHWWRWGGVERLAPAEQAIH